VKLTHRPGSPFWVPPSATVDPAYQAEVARMMARAERAWRQAERRLADAEHRLGRARRQQRPAKTLASLAALVELRRDELEHYRRAMEASPASAEHRGRRSFRPVPPARSRKI
jgi:hypothetical protein